MRQAEKKKGKDKVAAVLMLSFCVIALTSVFTIKASIDKISQSAPDLPVTTDTPTAPAAEAKKENADEKEKKTASAKASANIPAVDSRKNDKKAAVFISPIDMATAVMKKEYSMDMVVYNLTLDQYMTHPGIDFEAPAGSGVKAVADGTITDIYTDDAYGITIEISHGNGYTSRYCSLATDKLCEKGDFVKKGQTISSVGNSALYESMEKSHLHFELLKNGKLQDPAKFIGLA